MARLLNEVIGHQKIIQRLLLMAEREKLPHSLLFVGPPGVGKKMTAIAFAQGLICEKSIHGCGSCGPCLRVAHHGSESMLLVEPEKNSIKIEQIRGVIEFLNLQSVTKNRVIIIEGAQLMNPQASNSLLKNLEEPSAGTFFFLIAPSPKHVLSTIRSRCQIVRFAPLLYEDMKSKSQAPEWAIRASQGSFEKLSLLFDKDEMEVRSQAVYCLQRLKLDPWAYLDPEIKAGFRDRSQALRLSQHMALLLRDSVYWKIGEKTKILNADQDKLFEELCSVNSGDLIETSIRALQLENFLLQNRDPNLVFEEFWLKTSWRAH